MPGAGLPVSPERRAQIIALLDSRDDGLPVRSPSALAASGFVHGVWAAVSCPDCLANGRVIPGCESCGGRGTVEEFRRRDPYANEVVMPFGWEADGREAERARDRAIEVLGEQVRPPRSEADLLAEANARPYGWERERARMYREFDYAALDRALERLRGRLPGVSPYSERGLELLDGWLPDPLRAPSPAAGAGALVGRDVAIRRAILARRPTRVVAEEFGLSVSQVNRIVAAGWGSEG